MTNVFSVPSKKKNYQSYMVYTLTIIWSIVTGLIVSAGFYFFPEIWPRWLIFLGVSIFIAIFNLTLNRFGYVRLAGWSLTVMLWLYITIPCYSAGGIMAPGILSQMSVILTAGFLLGWRGGITIGLLTIFTDFGLVYMELTGHLPIPSVIHNPITRWIAAIIPFCTILALQYYASNHLRSSLNAMQSEMQKREKAEKINDSTFYQLGERIKELKTLYSVSHILQDENATYQKLYTEIADVIPLGWQYPNITAALISIDGTKYITHNYQPSKYTLRAETNTVKGTKIIIEVVYLQPIPEFDKDPFLKEEYNLINMLVDMLKVDFERRERASELKDYKYALDVASIVNISDANGSFLFVNDNFCKISKYSPKELLGKHHSIIWSGFHPPEYFDSLKIAMQNGVSFRGEFCNKTKDGSLYWVDTSIVPFLDESGTVYQYLSINHDITKQKESEYLLKEQAETFQAIIENTTESIYLISPEYKVLQFNTTAKERIQLTRGMELKIGADFREYLFQDNLDIFYSMFNDSLKGLYRLEEIKAKGVTDNYFWFQSKMSPVYNLKGELIGVRLLTESIDERKKAEVALRESEDKFKSIVEQSLVGIYIIQNRELVYVNPGFEKIFGYSKNKLVNKMTFEELIHGDDIELVQGLYNEKVNKRKTKQQYVFRAIQNDGTILHVEVIASLIVFNNEPAIIGTIINITDRVEEERRINQAILDAQENERLQIGMELHDNVQQILAGTGVFLEIAQSKLEDDKETVFKILNNLKKYNTEATEELRRLSHLLAPSIEEDTILEDKISWLIKSLKLDENLSISVHIDEFKKPLDNNTQLTFYRILQEQLNNILKHAKASTIEISIQSINHITLLQIKDNGNGFDINTKKEGIGLENIRRRVQMLNGKIDILSLPGKGCEIRIEIPVTAK